MKSLMLKKRKVFLPDMVKRGEKKFQTIASAGSSDFIWVN